MASKKDKAYTSDYIKGCGAVFWAATPCFKTSTNCTSACLKQQSESQDTTTDPQADKL